MADKIVTLQRPDDEALFDEYTSWARARRRIRSAVTSAVQQGKIGSLITAKVGILRRFKMLFMKCFLMQILIK